MRIAVLALIVLAAAGCSSKPAVSRDGRAEHSEATNRRNDRDRTSGSLRAAYRRLPPDPPMYSAIPSLLGHAAGKTCDAALAHVRAGDTRGKVEATLGPPDRKPRCWL